MAHKLCVALLLAGQRLLRLISGSAGDRGPHTRSNTEYKRWVRGIGAPTQHLGILRFACAESAMRLSVIAVAR